LASLFVKQKKTNQTKKHTSKRQTNQKSHKELGGMRGFSILPTFTKGFNRICRVYWLSDALDELHH